jgi:hypothetical protein
VRVSTSFFSYPRVTRWDGDKKDRPKCDPIHFYKSM